MSTAVFIAGQKKYAKIPPQGSPLLDAIRVASTAWKEKGFDNAKPSSLRERGVIENYEIAKTPRYTDEYVREFQRGISSCKVTFRSAPSSGCWEANCGPIDVPFLPVLFCLLDPDLEQLHLPGWPDGAARHTKRPTAEPRSHRPHHLYPAARLYVSLTQDITIIPNQV
jgi:hypothetical protein